MRVMMGTSVMEAVKSNTSNGETDVHGQLNIPSDKVPSKPAPSHSFESMTSANRTHQKGRFRILVAKI